MKGTRARLLAAAALAIAAVSATATAHEAPHTGLTGEVAERVERGEAALARGSSDEALAAFERAAAMQHAPQIELAIVRAQMQAGEYRRALAFAAHVAGAHIDDPAGAALYAWLLHCGGQASYAQRVMDDASARSPNDDLLRDTREALSRPMPVASGSLLELPHRFAPFAVNAGGPAPGASARVVAHAFLLDGGQIALTQKSSLVGASTLWVRDGLGRTRVARVERTFDSRDIAVLRIDSPLPSSDHIQPAAPAVANEPWAGSPGFVIEFALSGNSSPAWPRLRIGFFGPAGLVVTHAATNASNIASLQLPANGVVFDASGRWAGIASAVDAGSNARPMWISAASLRALAPELPFDDAASVLATPPRRLGADEMYERVMPLVLQVIAER